MLFCVQIPYRTLQRSAQRERGLKGIWCVCVFFFIVSVCIRLLHLQRLQLHTGRGHRVPGRHCHTNWSAALEPFICAVALRTEQSRAGECMPPVRWTFFGAFFFSHCRSRRSVVVKVVTLYDCCSHPSARHGVRCICGAATFLLQMVGSPRGRATSGTKSNFI